MDRNRKYGGPDDTMDAFLAITWHGAHDKGTGKNRERYDVVEIARDVRGGQFEIFFCSTRCLRTFFDDAVRELEKTMKAKK